jgi:hypothetical protein
MILGEFLGHFDVRPIADSISSNRSSNATAGPAKLPVAVSHPVRAIETGTNVPLGRRVGPQMRSEVSTIHNGGGSSCLWTF